MAPHSTGALHGQQTSLQGAFGAWLAREVPTVLFVTGVVAVLVLFRLVAPLGFGPPVDVAEVAAGTGQEFLLHESAALLMLAMVEPVRRFGPPAGWQRIAALAGVVVAASALAALWQALFLAEAEPQPGSVVTWRDLPLFFLSYAFPAVMLVIVGEFHRHEILSLEAMRAAEASRSALERETLQARLRTLEAQIEPHFLFNILANVRRLYEIDVRRGEAMMEQLIRYFEVSLPSLRDQPPTLRSEAQMVEAYLELQQMRMGRRLGFSIDIAPDLQSIVVPPMMLVTLVENAVKHGLAPQREGGLVEVAARREGALLLLQVADTGRGFGSDASGGGTGLANIRARLGAMFGASAGLTLSPRQPRGLTATIRMPAP